MFPFPCWEGSVHAGCARTPEGSGSRHEDEHVALDKYILCPVVNTCSAMQCRGRHIPIPESPSMFCNALVQWSATLPWRCEISLCLSGMVHACASWDCEGFSFSCEGLQGLPYSHHWEIWELHQSPSSVVQVLKKRLLALPLWRCHSLRWATRTADCCGANMLLLRCNAHGAPMPTSAWASFRVCG